MKTYRVSSDLKNFVRRVLVRSFYSCRMTKDKNGQWYCTTNASSDTFHKIVQRPMYLWDKTLQEKLKAGYVDRTRYTKIIKKSTHQKRKLSGESK